MFAERITLSDIELDVFEEQYLNDAYKKGSKIFNNYRDTVIKRHQLLDDGYKMDYSNEDKEYAQARAAQLRRWGMKAKAVKTYRAEDTYYWQVWYKD